MTSSLQVTNKLELFADGSCKPSDAVDELLGGREENETEQDGPGSDFDQLADLSLLLDDDMAAKGDSSFIGDILLGELIGCQCSFGC